MAETNPGIEGMRAAVRPMLLWILGFGSFIFIKEGIEGPFVTAWITLFLGGAGEWWLERPVLKVLAKITKKGEGK